MALLSGLCGAAGGALVGVLLGRPFLGLFGAAGGFVGGFYAVLILRRSNPNWPRPKSN
jgi:hypothetical protein